MFISRERLEAMEKDNQRLRDMYNELRRTVYGLELKVNGIPPDGWGSKGVPGLADQVKGLLEHFGLNVTVERTPAVRSVKVEKVKPKGDSDKR